VARPVYFDTSVFLEIGAKRSKHAKNIRALLKELRGDKIRIYTSIITIQEASVLSYRRGALARDDYGKISEFARVIGITKDIALTAAKREAEVKDNQKEEIDEKRNRKWDCFHIATAQQLGCSALYTTDERLIKRQKQLRIIDIKIVPPAPAAPELDFTATAGSVSST
jgi:predicted nucleic acid-binding protein